MQKKRKNTELVAYKKIDLDSIENEMVELVSNASTPKDVFMANQKVDMLTKLAAFKLKRLEIEAAKQINAIEQQDKPLEIVFVDSKSSEIEQDRIKKLDKSVREGRGIKEDA